MQKKIEEDISLPEEIEGKSVTVEDYLGKSEKEKKLSEEQAKFEYKVKKLEPEEKLEIEKEEKKSKLVEWIVLGLIFFGLLFLVYLLF